MQFFSYTTDPLHADFGRPWYYKTIKPKMHLMLSRYRRQCRFGECAFKLGRIECILTLGQAIKNGSNNNESNPCYSRRKPVAMTDSSNNWYFSVVRRSFHTNLNLDFSTFYVLFHHVFHISSSRRLNERLGSSPALFAIWLINGHAKHAQPILVLYCVFIFIVSSMLEQLLLDSLFVIIMHWFLLIPFNGPYIFLKTISCSCSFRLLFAVTKFPLFR